MVGQDPREVGDVRVGVVQLCSTEDVEANLEAARRGVEQAAELRCEFIALPENFAYLRREGLPFPCAQGLDGPIVGAVQDWAREHGVHILGGSFPEAVPGEQRVHNTSFLVGPGGELEAVYRKIHLFDVKLGDGANFTESKTIAPGKDVVVARSTLPTDQISEHSVIVGIMGGGSRSGSWMPARNNWAVGMMGGCDLDFREAQFGPGVTEIRAFAVMGGVNVVVPPDVRVECSGVGIMGGFDHKPTVISTTDPDSPVLRVTGLAIMGGVSITVRHPGETPRDARLRLKAERKAQRLIAKGK